MDNINRIDSLVDRLKSSSNKLKEKRSIDRVSENEELEINKIKKSNNTSFTKSISLLLDKYNLTLDKNDNIIDTSDNKVSKESVLRKFSNNIKIKLLTYKKNANEMISNKKTIYSSLLINIISPIVKREYIRFDYADTEDNNIKKGMRNF